MPFPRSKCLVGLDIGSSAVKAVELTREADGHRVVAIAVEPVPANSIVDGTIIDTPRGDAGFGYDPVFVPDDGDGRTFAEMSSDEKHAVSHRGRAFRALDAKLGAASSS